MGKGGCGPGDPRIGQQAISEGISPQPQRVYPLDPKGYTLWTLEDIPFWVRPIYPFGFNPYTLLGLTHISFWVGLGLRAGGKGQRERFLRRGIDGQGLLRRDCVSVGLL